MLGAFPAARTPNALEAPALRWGILGPGWIAQRFAESLHTYTRQQLVAVDSRDQSRADAFAGQRQLPKAHGSYEALLDERDVDIVYIATTHTLTRHKGHPDGITAGRTESEIHPLRYAIAALEVADSIRWQLR